MGPFLDRQRALSNQSWRQSVRSWHAVVRAVRPLVWAIRRVGSSERRDIPVIGQFRAVSPTRSAILP